MGTWSGNIWRFMQNSALSLSIAFKLSLDAVLSLPLYIPHSVCSLSDHVVHGVLLRRFVWSSQCVSICAVSAVSPSFSLSQSLSSFFCILSGDKILISECLFCVDEFYHFIHRYWK